ncbi:MAG: hypothetical protein ABJA81_13110 [Nocardioidaceae bacterium]
MSPTTSRQQVGLGLAGLLSALSIAAGFFPTEDGDVGPPLAILILGSVLGVIGLVAVVIAWRNGNRAAIRVAAGSLIINLLTSLPVFFVDTPAFVKVLVGISVIVTVLAVAMMFSPAHRPVPVLD